jgi:hypothetical protein
MVEETLGIPYYPTAMTYHKVRAGKVPSGETVIGVLLVDMFQQIDKILITSCAMTGTAFLPFDHGMCDAVKVNGVEMF